MTASREPATAAGRALLTDSEEGYPLGLSADYDKYRNALLKHILAIEAEAAAAALPDVAELAAALHHLHSVELWRWWEPEQGGGALVRHGTSPEFAAAILRALEQTDGE